MHGDPHNRGPQDASVKQISVLKHIDDETVGKLLGFHPLDGLMHVRIENFPGGFHALDAVSRQRVPQLLADQDDALAIFLIGRIVVALERPVEPIEHRNQIRDQALDAAPAFFVTVAFGALPEILKIGLPADQRLQQLFLLRPKFRDLRGRARRRRPPEDRTAQDHRADALRRLVRSIADRRRSEKIFLFFAFGFRHVATL